MWLFSQKCWVDTTFFYHISTKSWKTGPQRTVKVSKCNFSYKNNHYLLTVSPSLTRRISMQFQRKWSRPETNELQGKGFCTLLSIRNALAWVATTKIGIYCRTLRTFSYIIKVHVVVEFKGVLSTGWLSINFSLIFQKSAIFSAILSMDRYHDSILHLKKGMVDMDT